MTPAAGFAQPEEDRSAQTAPALVRTPAAAKAAVLKPNHIRSLALAGAVVGVALLPIAAAQATPPQSSQTQTTASGQTGTSLGSGSGNASGAGAGAAAGSGTAVQPAQALAGEFCGPNQSESLPGAGKVQLQTCVDQQNGTVFAQAYVSNDGTVPQIVAVDLTRTDGTLVQNQCVIAAGTVSAVCATSPIPASQGSGAYDSVAEAAEQGKPLSAGAVHVESGLVAPAAQSQSGSSSPTAPSTSSSSSSDS